VSAAQFAPRARRDLVAAVRWIAKDNPAAAKALRDSVARAAENIFAHPEIGQLRPEFANPPYRFLSLTGFPYLVVYTPERNPPLILRILHAARDVPELLQRHL
jgi:toxin ParE1/3/4